MEWSLTGEHLNFVSDRTASGQALCEAAALLEEGRADLMLAGGVEALGLPLLRALAETRRSRAGRRSPLFSGARPRPVVPAEAGGRCCLKRSGRAATRRPPARPAARRRLRGESPGGAARRACPKRARSRRDRLGGRFGKRLGRRRRRSRGAARLLRRYAPAGGGAAGAVRRPAGSDHRLCGRLRRADAARWFSRAGSRTGVRGADRLRDGHPPSLPSGSLRRPHRLCHASRSARAGTLSALSSLSPPAASATLLTTCLLCLPQGV